MKELNKRTSHARTHGYFLYYPRLCRIWSTMKSRCENSNRVKYKDYGGRGINICEEWKSVESFCKWALENGYADDLQIDRIDVNGNYEPTNCRWVAPKENSRNRRNTKYLTLNGETKCIAEWCENIPISHNTIYWWYRKFGREWTEKKIEKEISSWNRRTYEQK